MKPIAFLGSSLADLRWGRSTGTGFSVRPGAAGAHAARLKAMPSVGPGVREIRWRDGSGAFRVLYLVTRPEAVYVLHAFQKKTQATAGRDLALAAARLREVDR